MKSAEEIKEDMEKASPMDRLLCADVGYGKTEVALRAAFKAILDGKQVAILVPTTILAQQHYNTIKERFKNFPVGVGLLSRFRSKKDQKMDLEGLKDGNIDIIVGTHRLLSKDVKFKVVFDSYPAEAFDARLEEYLDISTAGTGIPVTITIDDPHFYRTRYDVKPGFTCKIKLASDVVPFLEEKLMNVPLSAVFGDSENRKTYVWVVEGNKVSRREVTVYSPTGEANLLISKGLEPGETVVTAGVYQLTEGEAIKVLM